MLGLRHIRRRLSSVKFWQEFGGERDSLLVRNRRFKPGMERLEDRTLMDAALSAGQRQALLDGFNELANGLNGNASVASELAVLGPLAGNLAGVTDQSGAANSLGQILQIGRNLNDALVTPAVNLLTNGTTPSQLATALSSVTNDGAFTYHDVVAPIMTASDVEFDVNINVTESVSEKLNLGSQAAAIGLTVGTPPSLAATANEHLHFVVDLQPGAGNDQYVFTMQIKTLDPADTAPVKLGIDIDVPYSATDPNQPGLSFGVQLPQAGGTSLAVSHGTFAFHPSVVASFANVDGQGVGSMTLSDLETKPLTSLIGLTPGGDLSASLPISAALPAPFNKFGAATITVHDANVFASAAPDVSLSINLTPAVQTQILSALATLQNVGGSLTGNSILSASIPLLNKSVNDLTGIGGIFQLHDAAQAYFNGFTNGQLPTAEGLANALVTQATGLTGTGAQGNLAQGPLSISAGLNAETNQLLFHVGVDANRSTNLPLDFGVSAQHAGLELSGSATTSVNTALNLDLDVGIDLTNLEQSSSITSKDVFFQINGASASVSVAATDLNFNVDLGFLQAGVTGGMASLNAGATLTFQKPGAADNKVTLFDLDTANNPAAVSIASLLSIQPASALSATLPLQAFINGKPIASGNDIPSIVISGDDLFHKTPTVQANLGVLGDFENVGPAQMLDLLNQITTFLSQYRQSDIFNIPIPLVSNTTLGILFDLGSSFSNKVLADLKTSGASIYSQTDLPDTINLAAPASFTLADENGLTGVITIPAGAYTIDALVTAMQNSVSSTALASEVSVTRVLNRIQILRNGTNPLPANPPTVTPALQITNGSGIDLLKFAVGETSSNPLSPAPLFQTAQDLANALLKELGLTGTVVNYDPATRNLTFHVAWNDTFPTLTLPLNLNLSFGDIANLTTSAKASLTGDVHFDFTFGINLGATNGFQLTGALPGVTPANGQLSGDANFKVQVGNNGAISVKVAKAATVGDQSLSDLAAAINNALRAAGLQTIQSGFGQQMLTLSANAGQTVGGTYTLSLGNDVTTTISATATAAALQQSLQALPEVGVGNVTVSGASGGPYTITFGPTKQPISQLLGVNSKLSGGSAAVTNMFPTVGSVRAIVNSNVIQLGLVGNSAGAPGSQSDHQVQTLTLTPDQGQSLAGTYTLTLDSNATAAIDIGASALTVQAALAALPNVGTGNVQVSGPVGGPFQIQFARFVDQNLVVSNPQNGTAAVQDTSVQVSAALNDPAVTQLEFPADGRLPADATFQLTINGGSPVTVTMPANSTSQNASMTDLAASINAALKTAGLDGQVVASALGNRISFQPVAGAGVTSLKINAAANDPTITLLGFQDGQNVKGQSTGLFFGTGNILSAHAHLAVDSPPGQSFATAQLGFVSLGIGSGNASLDATLGLGLQDPANTLATTISLQTLFADIGNGQLFQVARPSLASSGNLALGGLSVSGLGLTLTPAGNISVSLPNLLLPTSEINLGSDDQGRLGADDFFSLVVGSNASQLISLKQNSTSGNQSPADLLAQVNAALKAAGLDTQVQAAYDTGAAPGTIKFVVQAGAPVIAQTTIDGQGRLANDAHFTVTIGAAAPVAITITKSSTSNNLTFDDLVGEINAALKKAGVDGSVTAVNQNGQVVFNASAGVVVAPAATVSKYVQLSIDSALAPLLHLRNLSFTQIVSALQVAIGGLSDLSVNPNFSFLQQKIPGINKSAADLIDYAGTFVSDLGQLTQNPAQALSSLQAKIEAALGINHAQDPVTLTFDPVTNVFELVLDFTPSYTGSLPFNLDINSLKSLVQGTAAAAALDQLSNLVSADASGMLSIQANVDLKLALGIDLSNVLAPRPFLDAAKTGLSVGVQVAGTNLHFKVSAGPLGLFIGDGTNDGTVSIGAQGHPQSGPATFTVSLRNSDQSGRYYLDGSIANLLSDIRVAVQGGANVTLPIFIPTQDFPLGGAGNNNLVIKVNSLQGVLNHTAGAVTIQSPSFASAFSGLNALSLLNNPAVFLNGLDSLLGTVQSTLNGQVLSQSFPIIGTHLQDGAQFIQTLRTKVIGQLTSVIGNNSTVSLIQNALFAALGPGGLDILIDDTTGVAPVDASHIGVTEAGVDGNGISTDPNGGDVGDHFIEFHLHFKQALPTLTLPATFDIGLPGIGLSLNAAVNLALGWDLHLNFGVSTRDGFFFDTVTKDTTGAMLVNMPSLKVSVDAQITSTGPTLASGSLGSLEVDATPVAGKAPADLNGNFFVNITDPQGKNSTDDNRLTLAEILAGPSPSSVLNAGLSASAGVDLHLQASVQGSTMFPTLGTDFHLAWGFSAADKDLTGEQPSVSFNNIQLSLGQFISGFAGPILEQVKQYLDPIKPIVDALTTRLPVISDLEGKDVTLVDLAAILAAADPTAQKAVETTKIFLDAYTTLYALASEVDAVSSDPNNLMINFGSIDLGGADPRKTNLQDLPDTPHFVNGQAPADPQTQVENSSAQGETKNFTAALTHTSTFKLEFPLLSKQAPQVIFALLSGKTADLFQFDMQSLQLGFVFQETFPIVEPLDAVLSGSVNANIHFAFGYDTTGLNEFKIDKNPIDFLDGFYIRSDDGPQITIDAGIGAGAAVGFGPISAGVEGGIFAHITAALYDPNGDGKLRFSEIQQLVDPPGGPIDPLNLFDISGQLTFRLFAYINALFINAQYDIVPPITLLNFDLNHSKPILGSVDSHGTLNLNSGPLASKRQVGDTSDDNEHFTIRQTDGNSSPGALTVTYYEADGSTVTQNFLGVGRVFVDAGGGDNIIDCSGINVPVTIQGEGGNNQFMGGNSDNVLKGGTGADTLIGGTGKNTFTGNGGADTFESPSATNLVSEANSKLYILDSNKGSITTDRGVDTLVNTNPGGGNSFNASTWSANLSGANSIFEVSTWINAATLTGPNSQVIATNDAGFTLSDGALTRTPANGSPVTFTLQGINNVELTTGASPAVINVNGYSGSAELTSGAGGATFNVTSTHAALPNLILSGGTGANALNVKLHGTVLGDNNPHSIQAYNIESVTFDNSDNREDLTGTPWTCINNSLFSGSSVLLAANGATQTTLEFGPGKSTIDVGGVASPTTIETGQGADVVDVGYGVHPLKSIQAPLSIAGASPNSSVIVDNSADNTSSTGQLTAPAGEGYGHVTGLGMGGQGVINYAQSAVSSLTVKLGSAADNFNVAETNVPTSIVSGIGQDTVTVLDAQAPLTVAGGAQTTLLIDRTADSNDHTSEAIAAAKISGLGAADIAYSGLRTLQVNLGAGHNVLDIQDTSAGSTLVNLGGQSDQVSVEKVSGSTTINGQGPGDVVTLNIQNAAPTAGEFLPLSFNVPKLMVDNGGNPTLVDWQFQDGNLGFSGSILQSSSPFVNTTGAASTFITGGTNANNILAIISQGGSDQTIKLQNNTVQADTGAIVLSQSDSLTGTSLSYGSAVDGLATATNQVISADGRYVYVVSRSESSVAVFRRNASSGKLIFTQILKNGGSLNGATITGIAGPSALALSPDDNFLYVASHDSNSLVVFQINHATGLISGQVQTIVEGAVVGGTAVKGLAQAQAIAISPDGKFIYVGTDIGDNVLAIFSRDAISGQVTSYQTAIVAFQIEQSSVSALSFSADGSRLYAKVQLIGFGSEEDQVQTFSRDNQSGALTSLLPFNDGPTTAPTNQLIFSNASFFGTPANPSGTSLAMAVSPDGKFAIVLAGPVAGDQFPETSLLVYRRDPVTGLFSELVQKFSDADDSTAAPLPIFTASQIVISPDGLSVYVAGGTDYDDQPKNLAYLQRDPVTGMLRIGSSFSPGNVATLNYISSIAVSPNSQFVYVSVDHGSRIVAFHQLGGQLVYLNTYSTGFADNVGVGGGIAISPSGDQFFVTNDLEGSLRVFVLNGFTGAIWAQTQYLQFQFPAAQGIAISPDGASVYIAAYTGVYWLRRDAYAGDVFTYGQVSLGAHYDVVNEADDGQVFYTGPGRPYNVAVSADGSKVYVSDAFPSTEFTVYARTNTGSLNGTFFGGGPGYGQVFSGGLTAADGTSLFSRFTAPVFAGDGSVFVSSYGDTPGVALFQPAAPGQLAFIGTEQDQEGGSLIRAVNGLPNSGAIAIGPGPRSLIYVPGGADSALSVLGLNSEGSYDVLQWLQDGIILGGEKLSDLTGALAAAVSPDGSTLYVARLGNKTVAPAIVVFQLDTNPADAAYGLVTSKVQTLTDSDLNLAATLQVSPDGKSVYAIGAFGKDLATFSRNPISGVLTPVQSLVTGQVTAYLQGLTSVAVSPDGINAYAVSPDDNALAVFQRSPAGALALQSVMLEGQVPPPGQGTQSLTGLSLPQSVILSPDGKEVYVLSSADNALTVFSRNTSVATSDPRYGQLTQVQTVSSAAFTTLTGSATLAMTPDGLSIYVLTTTPFPVALFKRNPTNGQLSATGTPIFPGSLSTFNALSNLGAASAVAVSPDSSMLYLASAATKELAVFRRIRAANDPNLGTLVFVQAIHEGDVQGTQTVFGLGGSSAITASQDGKYVYVAGSTDNAVAIFSRDPATGMLTFVQVLQNGVDGIQGLGGASSVVVASSYPGLAGLIINQATGKPAVVPQEYLFVTGATDNAIAVFQRGTTPGSAVFGKLVFLQRLVNNAGGVTGLGTPNSLAADTLGRIYVNSSTGANGGGLADFAIATTLTPPTHYQLGYSNMGDLFVAVGNGNALIQDLGTPNGTQTAISTGAGADSIDLVNLGANATTLIAAGNGPDTFDLRSTATNANLSVSTGMGGSVVNVWSTGGGTSTTTINDQSPNDSVFVNGSGLPAGASRLTVNGDAFNPLIFSANNHPTDAISPAAHNGSVAATDGNGNDFGQVTYNNVTLTVNQSPPVASLALPTSISEGGVLIADGRQSLAGTGHHLVTYAFEINNSGQFVAASGGLLTLQWADLAQFGVTDQGSYLVRLRVTDDQGLIAETTSTLTVVPGVTALTLRGPATVRLFDTYTLSLQASDPNAKGLASWTIFWGDGATQVVSGVSTTATHVYSTPGAYTITGSAIDQEGGGILLPSPVSLTVRSFPKANAGGAYTITEGQSLTLNGSGSFDPDGSTLNYAWDITGSGQFQDASGVSPSFTYAQLVSLLGPHASGGNTLSIAVRTTDANGVDIATTTLTINDAIPTVTLSGAAAVNEGDVYTLNLAASGGGLTVDPVRNITINWGDGTPQNPDLQTVTGSATSATHIYAAGPNEWNIGATFTDSDGSYAAANSVDVEVNAVAPTLSLSGPSSVAAGSTYTLQLAVASDVNPAPLLVWIINWGDGSNPQTIPGTATSATHVFTQPGTDVFITVQATDPNGTYDANTPESLPSVKVHILSPITIAGQSITTVEGTPFSGAVGSITSGDPGVQASDFTALIQWGDGTTSPGQIAGANGAYTIGGQHTYAEDGLYFASATVYHGNDAPRVVTDNVTVSDPAVIGTGGFTIHDVKAFDSGLQTEATFTDPGGAEAIGDYAATIAWGDGSTSKGIIGVNNGTFTVQGSHAYQTEGSYSISVTLSHDAAPSIAVQDSAVVTNPAVNATGGFQITDVKTQDSGFQTVATFVDPAGAETLANYGATILWGDGTSSPGVITIKGGVFTVQGDHTYTTEGSYSVAVSISHTAAPTVQVEDTALVTNPAVKATGGFTMSAIEGVASAAETVATFTDPGGAEALTAYSALIAWGDGTTSAGTIAFSNGLFIVSGSHDYVQAGAYSVTTTINHTLAPAATAVSQTNVAFARPVVSPISGNSTVLPGQAVTLTAAFTDSGVKNTHSATFDWGDAASGQHDVTPGSVTESNGSGSVSGTHAFASAGTYTISLIVTSSNGAQSAPVYFTISVGQAAYLLSSSASGALTASGNAHITFPGVLDVDSNSKTAIIASDYSIVTASAINVVGGVKKIGFAQLNPNPTVGAAPVADPFANLLAPRVTGTPTAVIVNGNAVKSISPGVYSQIAVSGNGRLTLQPGVYVIVGGGITFTDNAIVAGTGVFLYNAGSNYPNPGGAFGSFAASLNANISLSPPAAGQPYAGLLLFQACDNTKAITLSDNASLGSSGTIYAPNAGLVLSSNAKLHDSIVVSTLNVSGNGISSPSSQTSPSAPASTLVVANARQSGKTSLGDLAPNELAILQTAATGIQTQSAGAASAELAAFLIGNSRARASDLLVDEDGTHSQNDASALDAPFSDAALDAFFEAIAPRLS
jgi:6-phosphogluconolactonase (cycloisomerase 2 family)